MSHRFVVCINGGIRAQLIFIRSDVQTCTHTPFSAGTDFRPDVYRRQILTSKVDPRTGRITIFMTCACCHCILPCKAKIQNLFDLQVSMYCLSTSHSSEYRAMVLYGSLVVTVRFWDSLHIVWEHLLYIVLVPYVYCVHPVVPYVCIDVLCIVVVRPIKP